MLINKRVTYCILAFGISFSLLLRYNKLIEVGHEDGTDSWDYHQLVAQISNSGKINWLINFFSIFGFYPPSQEMGVVTFTSCLYVATGLNLEQSIFLESFIIGTSSIFFGYILGLKITKNNLTALCFAFFFCFSPKIFANTSIGISIRDFFSIYLLICHYFFLRLLSDSNAKNLVLFLSTFFILLTIHRFSVLLIFLVITLLLSFAISYYRKNYLGSKPINFTNKMRASYFLALFLIVFISHNSADFYSIFSPSANYNLSLNFFEALIVVIKAYSYIIGIPIIFAPLGFLVLTSKTKIHDNDVFLLLSVQILSFLIFDTTYLIYFSLYIICFFSAFGFNHLIRIFTVHKSQFIAVSLLFVFVITSALAPFFVGGPKVFVEGYKSEDRWETGHYIKSNMENDDKLLTGYGISTSSINGISERPFWRDREIEIYESLIVEEISLDSFISSRALYDMAIDYDPRQEYLTQNEIDSVYVQNRIGVHSLYYILNTNYNELSYKSPLESDTKVEPEINILVNSFNNERYVIYESNNHSLIFVQ
tara:strand:- start:24839 stop:26449 length:1611 start_codon:yes stop_codon:yes gene_type:complete